MRRLLLYVHFNKHDRISPHVYYQLEKINPLFSKVVFISNSQLSQIAVQDLQDRGLIHHFIQRENTGFDFAAWRDGMDFIGFEELKNYDSVTLMNDTCFGPLWDLQQEYDKFESDPDVDFWGMTNNRKTHLFGEHIQSYFISFSRNVVQSEVFQEFWSNIQTIEDVQSVIYTYEAPVTIKLTDAGFKYKVVFDTINESLGGMPHPDFSFYNPTAILNKRVPFLKVKAFMGNQIIAPFLFGEIERVSDYPVDLIVNHMSAVHGPTENYLLSRKYFKEAELDLNLVQDKKIAIHLHTFYVDLLEDFLTIFKSYRFNYDLFITTNTDEKAVEIKQILATHANTAFVKVTGNIGRDVLPMLELKDQLEKYDYVGHFHTKKSKEADYWAGQSWRTELMDMLVKPANEIVANLSQKDDLGLVIADIPSYFRFVKMDPWVEMGMLPWMEDLWSRMGIKKNKPFSESHVFVMSYGTYMWFKYDALKPLFDLGLSKEEVPKEPLPQNTILHAFERMPVYVNWANGYDFRIVENPNHLTPFIDNKLINRRYENQFSPYAYVDFNQHGGLKGALKFMRTSVVNSSKYILKRIYLKLIGKKHM
ncbi:RgpFc protein [Streptococcus varani]|uniref:RgpFc protein n=2 Tax=Bacilli TaxID=91061 RepID=A0A0E3WF89_9STRE|nr:rhamnan synthesis F family protein [Streptococcus varani]CQR25079.1 RgpFc protein [Streptococcus varani]